MTIEQTEGGLTLERTRGRGGHSVRVNDIPDTVVPTILYTLTLGELKVLHLRRKGMRHEDIAFELNISYHTIRNAFEKAIVRNSPDPYSQRVSVESLMGAADKAGLLSDDTLATLAQIADGSVSLEEGEAALGYGQRSTTVFPDPTSHE